MQSYAVYKQLYEVKCSLNAVIWSYSIMQLYAVKGRLNAVICNVLYMQ